MTSPFSACFCIAYKMSSPYHILHFTGAACKYGEDAGTYTHTASPACEDKGTHEWFQPIYPDSNSNLLKQGICSLLLGARRISGSSRECMGGPVQNLQSLSSAVLLVTPCFLVRMQVFLVLATLCQRDPSAAQLRCYYFIKAIRKPIFDDQLYSSAFCGVRHETIEG